MAKTKATFEREEYEKVPADDNDAGDISQSRRIQLNRILRRIAWISIGVYLIVHNNLHGLLIDWKEKLSHSLFWTFLANVSVMIGSMIYMVTVVKARHGTMALRRWRTYARYPVYLMTIANFNTFILAIPLFYPHLGVWTLPILLLLSWSWLSVLTFIR